MIPPLTVSRPEMLIGGSDASFRTLVHGLLALTGRLDVIRAKLAALIGVSPIQYEILVSLHHFAPQAGISISHIAEHLHHSGAFITIEVGKLVQAGLVKKHVPRHDRRLVLVSVTPAGHKRLAKLAPHQRVVNDHLFAWLDAGLLRTLVAKMDEIIACGDEAVGLVSWMAKTQKSTQSLQAARSRGATAQI